MNAQPEPSAWRHELIPDQGGLFRLEIIDEHGVQFPVGRQLTKGQAELLVRRIEDEHEQSGRTVAEVIRDYRFMAACVLEVKGSKG